MEQVAECRTAIASSTGQCPLTSMNLDSPRQQRIHFHAEQINVRLWHRYPCLAARYFENCSPLAGPQKGTRGQRPECIEIVSNKSGLISMQSHPFTIHNRVDLPWNLPEKEIVDSLVTCLIGDIET